MTPYKTDLTQKKTAVRKTIPISVTWFNQEIGEQQSFQFHKYLDRNNSYSLYRKAECRCYPSLLCHIFIKTKSNFDSCHFDRWRER